MKISIFLLLLLCTTALRAQNSALNTATQAPSLQHMPSVIGDEVNTNIQTIHPYNTSNKLGVVFEQEFHNKNSAYIKLYFEDFDLGPEDYIEISTHNTGESIIYAGKGKIISKSGEIISDFWSKALLDERITVRLHAQAASKHYGFKISRVAYGYSAERIESIVNGGAKSICGKDDKQRIACYNGTTKGNRAKAVCKLIIGGVGSCTGWLLGCEGHLMTNNHCIGNAATANNTDYLFDYQYSSCSGYGTLTASNVASSATFIKTSGSLDYTLVKLPTNPTGKYGYLSLSSKKPVVGERIYIIGHPSGRRKEITVKSDQDASGYAQVNFLNSTGIRYYADTEGGNSGSPVLSNESNLVVAIHNTGGCSNGSNGRCDKLIAYIGGDMPKSGVDYSNDCTSDGCKRTITSLPSNENFEAGFGNWSQSTSDNFNWTRKTGSTPSSSTGPSAASQGSYYAYLESSSPNYPSKKAILNSPCYNVNVPNGYASFKYHMYGSKMGTLRFQVSTNNGSSWSTLWTKTGDQGNSWKSTIVNVSAYINTNGVRFRFYGTTGTNYTSDMAIDAVSIYSRFSPTNCISVYPYNESWETGFGIWSQSTSDDFNWTRKTGSTPSSSTGPSAASRGSYYIYTEASSPNFGGKDAIITSRCFNLKKINTPAASFRYHMYGSRMGKLKLQVSLNNSTWTTIWSKTGDQGNRWENAYVNLSAYSSNSNVRLRFVGTTGTSYTSDMAIDAFGLGEGFVYSPRNPSNGEQEASEMVSQTPFLSIAPNPFNDFVNVSTNIEGLTDYRLTNIQGQTIKQGLFQGNSIQLGDINRGVYFLTIYNEQEQIVRKVIKQ